MKKLILLMVLVLVLSMQFAAAAPPWKKTKEPTTSPTTSTTTATTSTTTAAGSANVPPQITSISLKPDPVDIDGTLKCSVAAYDGNGDTVRLSYQWSTTGSYSFGNTTASTLDLSKVEGEAEGDVITCVATPNDGKVRGISGQESVTISKGRVNWEMIAVVLAVIGAIAGWLISRRVRGKTAKYMSEIDKVYRTHNKNTNKCEAELTNIRDKIEDDFKKGKLTDQALSILEKRIEKYSRELRSDIIDKQFALPQELGKKVKHMLSDGVITKDEYAHFKDILAKAELGGKDKEELQSLMKKWKEKDKK